MKYILYAIPVFFLLIGIELLINKLKKTGYYRINDTVTNLNLGIGSQISGIFLKVLTVGFYHFTFENYRLIKNMPTDWYIYILLFIGIDFFYYWFHRLAHEIGVLWGSHVVHHQSEEYNLSVALRQSWSQGAFSWIFYMPLAFIGFNTESFVLIASLQTLYQFWIHTKLINRLPSPLEYVLNTPSHHRVHHGQNPLYIDKNHGGTLIIFDRLFGTFQAEQEEVVYGITKPANSWNPIWLNLDYYVDWLRTFTSAKGFSNKLKVIYMPPGWSPESNSVALFDPSNAKKYDNQIAASLNYYVLFQFVILLGFTSYFLNIAEANLLATNVALKIVLCLLIIYYMTSLGTILDGKKWSFYLELSRLFLFPICFYALLSAIHSPYVMALSFMISTICILSFTVFVVMYRSLSTSK